MKISIDGFRVEHVTFDTAITVLFSNEATLRIETVCHVWHQGGVPRAVDPERVANRQDVSAALEGRTVKSGLIDEISGTVSLELVGGGGLSVAAAPDFEAWTFSQPDGSLTVALPGGGVAHWESRA